MGLNQSKELSHSPELWCGLVPPVKVLIDVQLKFDQRLDVPQSVTSWTNLPSEVAINRVSILSSGIKKDQIPRFPEELFCNIWVFLSRGVGDELGSRGLKMHECVRQKTFDIYRVVVRVEEETLVANNLVSVNLPASTDGMDTELERHSASRIAKLHTVTFSSL
jgi:hypothetical protein